MIWLLLVVMVILMQAATSLLYKAGAHASAGVREEHIDLKYSVCVGTVFLPIVLAYLAMRDEPFTIWESAARFWPMTLFAIVYPVVSTVSFNGYFYNEAAVQSPLESLGGGTSTLLLIIAYLTLGRVDSVWELLTPLRTAGILSIMVSVILLSKVRNRENRGDAERQKASWRLRGLGTLVFPILFSLFDGLESVAAGLYLDETYGFGLTEGDYVIIAGLAYAAYALAFWLYILRKEGKPYNPFTRHSVPRVLGAVTDNVGIVFYSYAMAMNSVSTDPLLAVNPIFVMIGGRVLMKEKLSVKQYACLLGIVAGSVMVIVGTVL